MRFFTLILLILTACSPAPKHKIGTCVPPVERYLGKCMIIDISAPYYVISCEGSEITFERPIKDINNMKQISCK